MTPEELLKEVGEPVDVTNHAQLGYVTDGMHPDIPLAMWAKETSYSGANIALYTSDQVAAAVAKATKPLEDEVKAANGECELFRKNGRIVDANKIVELRAQLAAAQEENEHWKNGGYTNLWKQRTKDRDETIERQRLTLLELRDQLTKAEQRVAEACAKWIDGYAGIYQKEMLSDTAKSFADALRRGGWRKFVKKV